MNIASNLLRIADNIRDAYMIGEHVQNQRDTVGYSKEDKDAIERVLRDAARAQCMSEIDEAQMDADFASIPDRADGPMRRARTLVEAHIADYGMVPHPDRIKEAIAVELGLAEIRGADRSRAWAQGALKRGNALTDVGPDFRVVPVRVLQSAYDRIDAMLASIEPDLRAANSVRIELRHLINETHTGSPVTSTRLSPPAAPECECGFAADVCATNHCRRKQIASAGLSPVPAGYSKLPDGVVCKCFKMWRDANGDHWCCLPDKTRAATQPPKDGAAGGA